MKNENLIAKAGPAHSRQPTVFAPMLSRDPDHLKKLELMAWNAEVEASRARKKALKHRKERSAIDNFPLKDAPNI